MPKDEVFVSARTSSARSSSPFEKAENQPRRGPAPVFTVECGQADVDNTHRFLACLSRLTRTLSPEVLQRRVRLPLWPDLCHVQMVRPATGRRDEVIGTVHSLREGPGGAGGGLCGSSVLVPVTHVWRRRHRRGKVVFQQNFIQGVDGSA